MLIAPPTNALIASSMVWDYRDLLRRDLFLSRAMWSCFALSVASMALIDVVVVHRDAFRVETVKLAAVKDEEYVLNNQCLWYSVPTKLSLF